MNDFPNRFGTGSDPADIEIDKMLKNYYQGEDGEYPDFSKMAERAMAEGNTEQTNHPKVTSWYRIGKRAALTAASIIMMFGLLKLSFYAVPRWEQFAFAAIQSVPFAEHLISDQDIGLLREVEKGNVQVQQLSDTVDDFRIDILGTYADSNRTIIFFQLFPPTEATTSDSGRWMPTRIKLVDQFGLSHSKNYSVAMDKDDNKGMMEFPGVPSWLSALGVRFQLEIDAMDWTTAEESTEKTGPWTIQWVQEWQNQEQAIHPATTDSTSKAAVKLKKVTLTPSSTKLDFTFEFQQPLSFDFASGEDSKPPADEMYVEKGADGTRYDFLSAGLSTIGLDQAGKGDIIIPPLEEPGEYRFVIKRLQGIDGEWILPFTIPEK